MITQSGVHIQKVGGAMGTPTPEDIAVHAGRLCRFGGAVWYPLLPHLVFVGLLAYRRSNSVENMLWGFLHDAHEVVTNDVPRPFKCDCMRFEQNAIDDRLFREYSLHALPIDFKLIKKCDIDACHIEAVELKLPNFETFELVHSKDYTGRDEIYKDENDRKLFRRILHSPFMESTLEGLSSVGTSRFAHALRLAKSGQWTYFKNLVKGWNLI